MAQKQDIRTQLLTASPFQLMLSLSVPAIIGMVVVGLYNFMDRVFVGQLINEVAMGAVSVSYPFTLINTGVSTLIGVYLTMNFGNCFCGGRKSTKVCTQRRSEGVIEANGQNVRLLLSNLLLTILRTNGALTPERYEGKSRPPKT